MLSTIFVIVVFALYIGVIFGGMMDDEDKKTGKQPRKYYYGKAGMKYKAPGDRESFFMGWLFLAIIIFAIIGAILGG